MISIEHEHDLYSSWPDILYTADGSGVWAKKIPESGLYMAPNSLLQQKQMYTHGRLEQNHDPLNHTMKHLLNEFKVLPDLLLPPQMYNRCHPRELGWNDRTDAHFALVEELADVARIFMMLAIADKQSVNDLKDLYRQKEPNGTIHTYLSDQLSLSKSPRWLRNLMGDERYGEVVPTLVDLLVYTMQSRRWRGVDPVQNYQTIWNKLTVAPDVNKKNSDTPYDRVGELTELTAAARTIDSHGKSEVLLEVYSLVGFAEQFITTHYQESMFYENLKDLINRFEEVVNVLGYQLSAIVDISMKKHGLRMHIGRTIRTMPELSHFGDKRGLPKVITQLVLPWIIAERIHPNKIVVS